MPKMRNSLLTVLKTLTLVPSEGETGKREEDPKEEHMEAMRREAEQLCEQWEKTKEAA